VGSESNEIPSWLLPTVFEFTEAFAEENLQEMQLAQLFWVMLVVSAALIWWRERRFARNSEIQECREWV
jgi:hypothetical protein